MDEFIRSNHSGNIHGKFGYAKCNAPKFGFTGAQLNSIGSPPFVGFVSDWIFCVVPNTRLSAGQKRVLKKLQPIKGLRLDHARHYVMNLIQKLSLQSRPGD